MEAFLTSTAFQRCSYIAVVRFMFHNTLRAMGRFYLLNMDSQCRLVKSSKSRCFLRFCLKTLRADRIRMELLILYFRSLR